MKVKICNILCHIINKQNNQSQLGRRNIFMSSVHYLQHLQNSSPAKTTFSFSRGDRFARLNLNTTPNKFYDFPNIKSKRGTSFGFGNKYDMVNRNSRDPGAYEIKGQFQLLKVRAKTSLSSTFGESHTNIFDRKLNQIRTPGPGQYKPENYKNKLKFYMGNKFRMPQGTNSRLKLGPQSYKIDSCLDKISKFKTPLNFRIRTQLSKSRLQKVIPPGPGAYNPEKTIALQEKAKNKTIKGAASFSKQKRSKTQVSKTIGPGSYQVFSVFGSQQFK